jgi:signal peptidase II
MFRGYVIDFINLPHWPTFNLADIFIDTGVVLLIIYLFKISEKEK